jgi:DNA invertase Pin-like site-specific DNA recombinase
VETGKSCWPTPMATPPTMLTMAMRIEATTSPLTNLRSCAKLLLMGEKPAVSTTCITYCRTSTRGQKDRMTIVSQRSTVERLRKELGAKLLSYGPRGDGRLEDDGRSARLLEGREFATLIDDIEHERVKLDFLIVAETSRLSRQDTFSADPKVQIQSGIDDARINSVLRVRGVKVIDTKGEHLDLRQEALENSHDRDRIRRQTMRGKAEKFAEGKRVTGGYASYGYRIELKDPNDRRSGLVQKPHPENAAHLVRLIGWFIEDGYAHAAREATRAGFLLPKTKKARPWNAVTVRHIILKVRNGIYSGKQTFTFDGESHTLTCEPLPEIHKMQAAVIRACDELSLPAPMKFLSTGFVDCKCGAHVHERNSHSRHHTACASKCGRVAEKRFSETLWRATVARLIQIHEHDGGERNAENFEARLREAQAKLKDAEDALGQLWDAKISGELPASQWKPRHDQLTIKRARAQADVHKVEGEREKEERERTNRQTLEARINARLAELKAAEFAAPDALKRKREWLGDLLDGGRVTVAWGRAKAWRPPAKMRPAIPCVACEETHSPDVQHCAPHRRRCGRPLTGTHCEGCHRNDHDIEGCPIFGRWAEITFPAYRDLPPIVMARTDDPPHVLEGGVTTADGQMYLRVKQPWDETHPDVLNLIPAQEAHWPRSRAHLVDPKELVGAPQRPLRRWAWPTK